MGFSVLKPTASWFGLGHGPSGFGCFYVGLNVGVCPSVVGMFGLCWILCELVCVRFVFAPLTLSIWLWLVTLATKIHRADWPTCGRYPVGCLLPMYLSLG